MPYLRFFHHQRPCLLRAFFRPPVAGTPLRFANPSPPSGWVKDFHLQVSVHTPHTPQPPFRRLADASRLREEPPERRLRAGLPALQVVFLLYFAPRHVVPPEVVRRPRRH